mmetsp:Transcript_32700/g.77044  ORF Transcript_32700/g.77044 Transcript_32700/m.77044 type:complete len:139 (-) Transcript_32700:97-513(-)
MSKNPLERIPDTQNKVEQVPTENTREIIPADPDANNWNFRHAPCFRETMMYSIATASVFGLTEASRKSGAIKVGNTFMATFSVVALGTWGLCRYQKRQRHKAVVEGMREEVEKRRTGRYLPVPVNGPAKPSIPAEPSE